MVMVILSLQCLLLFGDNSAYVSSGGGGVRELASSFLREATSIVIAETNASQKPRDR